MALFIAGAKIFWPVFVRVNEMLDVRWPWNVELLVVDRFCILTAIFDVNVGSRQTTMTVRLPFLSS